MPNEKNMSFLLEFREFKGTVNTKLDTLTDEIKNIRDGTYTDILDLKQNKADTKEVDRLQGLVNEIQKKVNSDHETRLVNLETTRSEFRDKLKDNARYLKFLIWIGILFIGLLIFHLTGYHI
jgi:hypothetical protein